MKKILEFECPDEDESYNWHANGPKYHNVLWELLNHKLRPIWKHGAIPEGYKSEEIVTFAEDLKSYIYELIREEGVDQDF